MLDVDVLTFILCPHSRHRNRSNCVIDLQITRLPPTSTDIARASKAYADDHTAILESFVNASPTKVVQRPA